MQIPHRVQAHITETLHNERFTTPSGGCADHAHVARLVDKVLQAVEDTTSGGGDTAVDAALVDGFAGDAGVRVDVGVADGFGVGVGDPGHFALAGAHVWGGHVDSRPCGRLSTFKNLLEKKNTANSSLALQNTF